METRIETVGGKRILKIFCEGCKHTGSLTDGHCRKCVTRALMNLEGEIDTVAIIKDFRRVYPREQIDILRELGNLEKEVSKINVRFPLVKNGDKYLGEVLNSITSDTIRAYLVSKEQSLVELPERLAARQQYQAYKNLMKKLANGLEKTKLITLAKKIGLDKSAYPSIFTPWVIPSFVTSYIAPVSPDWEPIETYNVGETKVSIYSIPDREEKLYVANPPEFLLHSDENAAILKALDEISKHEPEVIDPRKTRDYFRSLARNIISEQLKGYEEARINQLADIAARYSAGYGLLEVLLEDEHLQDIYVDSPGENFVYVYHEKFEDCITNVILSKDDLERIAARLRAISGRPFDESVPVIHTEIMEYKIRVAGLHPPATFDGIGFAFRRGRPKPWTLPQLVNVGSMSPEISGLISFLVSGESSMLITGARGSGKTSLLASILGEIDPRYRMIVIEDTPELPVEQLKKVGYKIQHIRIKASLGDTDEESYELSASAALRTALRLGESVLVLGEVRGPEARALFEAMRIGAAGNVVLGTIHGSSAYDTWDRIVNDLGVPTTSFKATDIVISTAAIRRVGENVRKRRVMAVTEVRKEWREDPYHEGGFFDLAKYDPYEDAWIISKLDKSEIIRKISEIKGIKLESAIEDIKLRGEAKRLLVDFSRELKNPELLEVENVARFNSIVNRVINASYSKGKLDKARARKGIKAVLERFSA